MFKKLVNEKIIFPKTVTILSDYNIYNIDELRKININYLVEKDKRVDKAVLRDIINILLQ